MNKLPKLHLLSDLKSNREEAKHIYRVGDVLHALSGSNAVKYSALALHDAELGMLPTEFSIPAEDWKILSDGFEFASYTTDIGGGDLHIKDRKGKNVQIVLSEVPEEIKAKLEVPYSPDGSPLPSLSQTELCVSPKWLTNVTTACSKKGAAGLVVIEPLRGIGKTELNQISAQVIVEEPNPNFIAAVVIADYRQLEPVDATQFIVPEQVTEELDEEWQEEAMEGLKEEIESDKDEPWGEATEVEDEDEKENLVSAATNPEIEDEEDDDDIW